MKAPHKIALGVIVVSMLVMLFAFSGAVAHHMDIKEVRTRPNEICQVPGQIIKDTVTYDATKGELRFDIAAIDPKTRKVDLNERMTVAYGQPKPENFDEAVGVEAIGKYKDGVFYAHNLLVKCPSKYSDDKSPKIAQK